MLEKARSMEKQTSEVEKFFEGLPNAQDKEADIFSDKPVVNKEKENKEVPDPEEVPESIKNRQHRRLEERLQAEREANIVLTERLKALSEVTKVSKGSDEKLDPRLLRAFGTTEAGKEVTQIFSEILTETEQRARQKALEDFESRQNEADSEVSQEENYIDNQLESLEDKFNIDLTSDSEKAVKIRSEFLDMVEKFSPKDERGVITDYADFGSTFEYFLEQRNSQKVDTSRRTQLASRQTQRSQGDTRQTQITPGFRGWETDLNINN